MAIKFSTNVPQTLCFPYADFMEVNGQYGQQFLYTVEVDSQRDKLYATPNLHDQIQADGIAPGSVLTITKVEGEGNRKDWLVHSNGGNGHPDIPQQEPTTAAKSSPSNGHERPSVPDFAGIQILANHCLQTSWSAWNSLEGGEAAFTSEDVCKLGISVFIECCHKGITPPLVEIVAGLEDENEDALPF
jgi:hypothetical protein